MPKHDFQYEFRTIYIIFGHVTVIESKSAVVYQI